MWNRVYGAAMAFVLAVAVLLRSTGALLLVSSRVPGWRTPDGPATRCPAPAPTTTLASRLIYFVR